MTQRADGHTPKTYAQSEIITAVYTRYRVLEAHPDEIEGSPAFRRTVLAHLREMHNKLLDKTDLNGLHIEPTEQ